MGDYDFEPVVLRGETRLNLRHRDGRIHAQIRSKENGGHEGHPALLCLISAKEAVLATMTTLFPSLTLHEPQPRSDLWEVAGRIDLDDVDAVVLALLIG